MKTYLLFYFYYDKSKDTIKFTCYGFHYHYNYEYSITKLHESKLLLDNSLCKLYNYIENVFLQIDNTKLSFIYNMPMHTQHSSDYFYHEFLNIINNVIPLSYLTTGLVLILGVWIINIVKPKNNANINEYKSNYKNLKKIRLNIKSKKKLVFPALQGKLTKSLDFLGNVKLVVNNIWAWTSHISSFSSIGGVSFGLGGAGEDGDEDGNNWKKYFDNLEKNNERSKLNRKKKQIEKSIAANNNEISLLLAELAILTQQIVDQRIYSEGRQWNFSPEESINNAIQLHRWRERSDHINTRINLLESINLELNRQIIRELDLRYANSKKKKKKP